MAWKRLGFGTVALFALAVSCGRRSPLLAPTPRDLARVGPDSFLVRFETSRGSVLLMAHRAWSPLGVDRIHFLIGQRYYDGARFFRVVPGFVVQWGISGDPAVNAVWDDRNLPDEPVRQSNTRGRVSFARGGPNTRSVQLYVNLADNSRLDTTSTFGFPRWVKSGRESPSWIRCTLNIPAAGEAREPVPARIRFRHWGTPTCAGFIRCSITSGAPGSSGSGGER